ncbi:MAG: hypothetical protein PWQ20_1021 [Thermotogaceae bacterium]|nr:hypothetical protein [Thermotogaceae bacterium]MDN5337951.1 hypothetical protein [Thermotogaceae bacterium]
MKRFSLFIFLMLSWIVISSSSAESFLIGIFVSIALSFLIANDSIILPFSFFYSYFLKIPQSILEAFELLFNILKRKRIVRRIVDLNVDKIYENDLAIMMLSITLTPKTIAFDFLDETLFIHEVFFEDD